MPQLLLLLMFHCCQGDRLEDDWVPVEDTRPADELEKEAAAAEAHNRAVVLEMIGDLPEADVKPPPNMLFVCKLNPVTTEEDLDIIFSRWVAAVQAMVQMTFCKSYVASRPIVRMQHGCCLAKAWCSGKQAWAANQCCDHPSCNTFTADKQPFIHCVAGLVQSRLVILSGTGRLVTACAMASLALTLKRLVRQLTSK